MNARSLSLSGTTIAALFLFLVGGPVRAQEAKPELVTFTSEGKALHGFIYKPAGKGPFPAVIYNHGSDKVPGWFPTLGKFWTDHGFAFFVPHRPGHGRSAGDWIVDQQRLFREKEKDNAKCLQNDVRLHERANVAVVDAVAWLKQQPFVKTDSIIMSGISYGGIQTVLACEKDIGVRAFVPFSPGAMSWQGNALLRERLLQAVKHHTAPVFLLQAKNDYNLGPCEFLGAELKAQGTPNRVEVFPVFGDPGNPKDGHGGFAVHGSDVWGSNVLTFVRGVMKG